MTIAEIIALIGIIVVFFTTVITAWIRINLKIKELDMKIIALKAEHDKDVKTLKEEHNKDLNMLVERLIQYEKENKESHQLLAEMLEKIKEDTTQIKVNCASRNCK